MQRHELIDLLKELKLYGMVSAYDETVALGIKTTTSVSGDTQWALPDRGGRKKGQVNSLPDGRVSLSGVQGPGQLQVCQFLRQ
jgi:hypothetical protein